MDEFDNSGHANTYHQVVPIENYYNTDHADSSELKTEVTQVVSVNKKVFVSAKIKKELREDCKILRANLKEILSSTNATPLHRHCDFGYVCCYCDDKYQDPACLKLHTLTVHKDNFNPVSSYAKNRKIEYCIKLDITGLRCKLCSNEIDSLENVMTHLKYEHQKDIFLSSKNQIVPFKFDTEVLTCCLCSTNFQKFRTLQEHMHCHYRNYVCETCDAGYVTYDCLVRHMDKHKTGTFTCDFCSKVLDTKRKKKLHEKSVHTQVNMTSKCGYCNERFMNAQRKDEHLAKEHGVARKVIKCQACDRTFENKRSLTTHTKRDHLMERKNKCSQCDMKFYTTSELKMHMIRHAGSKPFQCDICTKAYGRKKTLAEHMRIHNGDKRFHCTHCRKAFVQKCSWRGHMRNRHGVIV